MKWSSTKQILKAKKLLRPDIETSEIAKKGGCNCCSAGTKNKRDLRLKRTKDFQLRGQGGEEAACSKNRDFHQTESLFWGLTDFLNPICGVWNMRLSRAYFILLQSVVNTELRNDRYLIPKFYPQFSHFLAIFSHFLLLSKILPQVSKIFTEIYLPYP